MVEKFIGTVKAFKVGDPDSKVVTILKETRQRLGEENTDHFTQWIDDEKGHIILQPIKRRLEP